MELPSPGSGSGSGVVAEEGRLQTSDPRAGLREELASALRAIESLLLFDKLTKH